MALINTIEQSEAVDLDVLNAATAQQQLDDSLVFFFFFWIHIQMHTLATPGAKTM